MSFLKRWLWGSKEDAEHPQPQQQPYQSNTTPQPRRKPPQTTGEPLLRDALGTDFPCKLQGLDWYSSILRVDSDEDVAIDFLEEPAPAHDDDDAGPATKKPHLAALQFSTNANNTPANVCQLFLKRGNVSERREPSPIINHSPPK